VTKLLHQPIEGRHQSGVLRIFLQIIQGCALSSCMVVVCMTANTAQAATTADEHYQRAWHAYESGDYDHAREEFERAAHVLEPKMAAAPTQPQHTADARIRLASTPQQAVGHELATYIAPYKIGQGDALDISVWQVEDLTRQIKVRPDGKMAYPLVGDMPAEGLTLTELSELLTERLKTYVRDPQVTIELTERGFKPRFIVLGEVKKQGIYDLKRRYVSMPEAIARAEGLADVGAKIKDVVVVKGYPQNPQMIHVNVKDMFTDNNTQTPVLIGDGDIIYISRTWIGSLNHFFKASGPTLGAITDGVTTYILYDDFLNNPANN
jgi:polysaccharide biosynthesis/export protein